MVFPGCALSSPLYARKNAARRMPACLPTCLPACALTNTKAAILLSICLPPGCALIDRKAVLDSSSIGKRKPTYKSIRSPAP